MLIQQVSGHSEAIRCAPQLSTAQMPELLSRYGHRRSTADCTHTCSIPRDLALSDASQSGLSIRQHGGFESSGPWRADKLTMSI